MEILCAPYTALISISFRNSLCLERVLKIQAQTVAIPSLFKEKKKKQTVNNNETKEGREHFYRIRCACRRVLENKWKRGEYVSMN